MKKIIVWGWGRDATITAVRKVIERGIAEPVLWISPADESFYGPKEFAYIPSCVLESLVTEQGGLTIEDIRQLEKQAQMELSKRMEKNDEENCNTDKTSIKSSQDAIVNEPHPDKTSDMQSSSVVDYDFNHRNSSISAVTNQERLLEIHMKHIEAIESDDGADDDDDSFYDALGTQSYRLNKM